MLAPGIWNSAEAREAGTLAKKKSGGDLSDALSEFARKLRISIGDDTKSSTLSGRYQRGRRDGKRKSGSSHLPRFGNDCLFLPIVQAAPIG